jgi:uncharacterized protein (TIGR03083 family)
MSDRLDVLQQSVAHLHDVVTALSGDQLRAQSYDDAWTVADVCSHIGSGAVIMYARVDAALAGNALDPEFAPPVWDEWNAKSPEDKAADALAADRALLDRFLALSDDERASMQVSLGPLALAFDDVVGLRMNEHVLHTWDIDVAFDPKVTLSDAATRAVVDNLEFIARFTAKATGPERDVAVHTTEPDRDFVVAIRGEGARLQPVTADAAEIEAEVEGDPERLSLPAEAFVRLVYGRLDPEHDAGVDESIALDGLREVFPGP